MAIALTWEFYRRVWRDAVLGVVAAALVLPACVHGMQWLAYRRAHRIAYHLSGEASVDLGADFLDMAGVTRVVFHLVFGGLLVIVALGSILRNQRLRPGHFWAPAPTWLLAACRMLPEMALIAAMYLVIAESNRLMSGWAWPLWGPALFCAAAIACGQATIWSLPDFRAWKLVASLLLWASLLVFGITRYSSGGLGWPTRMWAVLTITDALVLVLHAGVTYALGVVSLARLRSNDRRHWPNVRAWCRGIVESMPGRRQSFRSPFAAQIWLEWREKGVGLSLIAAGIMILIVLGWALFGSDAEGTMNVALVLILVWGFASLVSGLVFGLRAGALSTLVVGAVCVIGLGVTIGSLYVSAEAETALYRFSPELFEVAHRLGFGFPPLVIGISLLVAWTIMALSASVMLTGRLWVPISFIAAPYGLKYLMTALQLMLPLDYQPLVVSAHAAALGVTFLLGTGWLFFKAWRRRLIGPFAPWIACGIWLALAAICAPFSAPGPAAIVFYLGRLALPVCPIAAAPLAIAWNRHR